MRPIKVVESRHWRHTLTGRTASIHGACPYTASSDKPNWAIVSNGYAILYSNGTIHGMAGKPFATRALAQSRIDSRLAQINATIARNKREGITT